MRERNWVELLKLPLLLRRLLRLMPLLALDLPRQLGFLSDSSKRGGISSEVQEKQIKVLSVSNRSLFQVVVV